MQTPSILGKFDPPQAWISQLPVNLVRDPTTEQPILGNDGNPLKDYPGLPLTITYDSISPAVLESFFRIHPLVSYQDVWMRVDPLPDEFPTTPAGLKTFNNKWNNRRSRECRELRGLYSWINKSSNLPKETIKAVDKISAVQLSYNTVWLVDEVNQAISEPGHPENRVPLTFFLENHQFPHQPSPTVQLALQRRDELNQKAQDLGRSNFTQLDPQDRPAEWYSRRADKGASKGVQVTEEEKRRAEQEAREWDAIKGQQRFGPQQGGRRIRPSQKRKREESDNPSSGASSALPAPAPKRVQKTPPLDPSNLEFPSVDDYFTSKAPMTTPNAPTNTFGPPAPQFLAGTQVSSSPFPSGYCSVPLSAYGLEPAETDDFLNRIHDQVAPQSQLVNPYSQPAPKPQVALQETLDQGDLQTFNPGLLTAAGNQFEASFDGFQQGTTQQELTIDDLLTPEALRYGVSISEAFAGNGNTSTMGAFDYDFSGLGASASTFANPGAFGDHFPNVSVGNYGNELGATDPTLDEALALIRQTDPFLQAQAEWYERNAGKDHFSVSKSDPYPAYNPNLPFAPPMAPLNFDDEFNSVQPQAPSTLTQADSASEASGGAEFDLQSDILDFQLEATQAQTPIPPAHSPKAPTNDDKLDDGLDYLFEEGSEVGEET